MIALIYLLITLIIAGALYYAMHLFYEDFFTMNEKPCYKRPKWLQAAVIMALCVIIAIYMSIDIINEVF